MRIRATTRLLAVIGDPVGHSLSPAMHNAAISALGLDAVFLALRATRDTFPAVARALVSAGGALNVTVPHKRAAAELLDHPTALVRRTGACNTIWPEGGRIAGDTTDVLAIAREAAALLNGRPVRRAIVLGTGGSARAAAAAIGDGWTGAEIAVVSRDAGRAAEFVRWGKEAGIRVSGFGVGDVGPADLVVNATPLGLAANDAPPLDADQLKGVEPAALLDLVYAAGETALVRMARAAGARAADGRGVLVAQGAASFQLFFGVPAPEEIMRATVEDALRA
jgi:shikimate dehydrogenase